MRRPLPSLLWPFSSALAGALAAAACAPPGPYPSLEPRPIEKALADTEELPAEAALPDDAGLPPRVAALLAQARTGSAEFDAALPEARSAAARAGAPESESWIEAQQALSRLEAASATTRKALADLDAFALAEEQVRRLSPGDIARLQEAVRSVQALADRQSEDVARIKATIGD